MSDTSMRAKGRENSGNRNTPTAKKERKNGKEQVTEWPVSNADPGPSEHQTKIGIVIELKHASTSRRFKKDIHSATLRIRYDMI